MITLKAEVKILCFKKSVLNETRSIIQTISSLTRTGNYFVATLILLFSIIIPFAKGILLLYTIKINNKKKKTSIYNFINKISKWSMADVFLIGILVAVLSAKAADLMDAYPGIGFYFFAGYCLLSLTSLHFFKEARRNPV
jgi:uncharacterized paraquat-inducible protein A